MSYRSVSNAVGIVGTTRCLSSGRHIRRTLATTDKAATTGEGRTSALVKGPRLTPPMQQELRGEAACCKASQDTNTLDISKARSSVYRQVDRQFSTRALQRRPDRRENRHAETRTASPTGVVIIPLLALPLPPLPVLFSLFCSLCQEREHFGHSKYFCLC